MTHSNDLEIREYSFNRDALVEIGEHPLASSSWPLVYILSRTESRLAYVGETADTAKRMTAHLKHTEKGRLSAVHLISSEKFNKSATLDIESRLIRYMAADGKFKLLNANLGLSEHNYFQKQELYSAIFNSVWDKLRAKGLASHSVEYIENTDLFKYSPYKSLSPDQRDSLVSILKGLVGSETKTLLIQGGAGTGKSVLATFLFKLLCTNSKDLNFEEFAETETEIRDLVWRFKQKFPSPKMALVVPMSSFRATLQKAFMNIEGLTKSMVIGPADVSKNRYDLLLVDEAHRLRKRKSLTNYKSFDDAANRLGFDKFVTDELQWVQAQSQKSVLFYDSKQSVRPSDVSFEEFEAIRSKAETKNLLLKSQFRIRAGNDFVRFVNKLMDAKLSANQIFKPKGYELKLFYSLSDMVDAIKARDQEFGLSRLIAGFSWPWISKKDPDLYDIEIDGVHLKWNSTASDWMNSEQSVDEVGCIHTTQGYDLNYTGVIFGKEIDYDPIHQQILIYPQNYHDRNGKSGVSDPEQLKQYIINIYKTVLLRGMRGAFVYACNPALQNYLSQYIETGSSFTNKESDADLIDLIAYKNAVPLLSLEAAAGSFSEVQDIRQLDLIRVPDQLKVSSDMFACKVVGESMNRVIPNGAICLFRKDRGGSRNGKIVLVEHSRFTELQGGSRYTVKEYRSQKSESLESWRHTTIVLSPKTYETGYDDITLTHEEASEMRVVGEFLCVIETFQ